MTKIEARGAAPHWLAVLRSPREDLPTVLADAAKRWRLTSRQGQVLSLLAEGLPNKILAQCLGVTENTVEVHVTAVLAKAQVASRTELVSLLLRGP